MAAYNTWRAAAIRYARLVFLVGLFALLAAACSPQRGACATMEAHVVRGASMEPLVHDGASVTIARGYYACHDVGRGDVVLYQYAGNADPLLKQVRAIPGDHWHLQENGDGSVAIVVNNETLRTAAGGEYRVSGKAAQMLRLYATDYPIIPAGAYLLLGEVPSGSVDSTRFGLVDKSALIGRLIDG